MAARNSSGVERRRVRVDGNRPRTHPSPKPRRKTRAGYFHHPHGPGCVTPPFCSRDAART